MSGDLDTAAAIATRLAAEAIWHEGRCNWVGPAPGPVRGPATVRSLGPELYAGTAGLALVLAEVAVAVGDERCRRTAVGAALHALAQERRIDPSQRLGFHGGHTGIAVAAIRTGLLAGREDIVEWGRSVAASVHLAPPAATADVVGGRAGAVAGLLVVGAALSESAWVARAVELADATAPPDGGGRPGPPGLAHGGAGIAWALLELWHATGLDRFRDEAAEAWRAEDARLTALGGVTSEMSWCNGPPGIALVRRRSSLLTGDGGHDANTAQALQPVEMWTRAALRSHRGSYCLCHGVAGNAEILRDCAPAAGDGAPALDSLADDAAAAGIEEYGDPGRPWPCGRPGGESPGLMIGLAGIARFYLRRARPGIPSVLLPRAAAAWGDPRSASYPNAPTAAAASMRP